MDYHKIGQLIRKYRKERGFSQEELAELINISTTHMSHIETGNTKLSLPVLVDIAQVLQVRADDLLTVEKEPSVQRAWNEISHVLGRCSEQEANVIADIVKAAKLSMDKHR